MIDFNKALFRFLLLGMLFTVQVSAQDVEWDLSDSQVGIGTGSPAAKLHVLGESEAAVEELFRLESTAAPQQVFLNASSGATWLFAMTSNDTFKISYAGTGKVEARFRQNGNLEIAGSLSQNSDRHSKINIDKIDDEEVLKQVVSLPISSWEYKADTGVKHLGPMAQDFYSVFGLGESPTSISPIDTGGVALAAIKGLKKEKDSQIAQLKAESNALAASNSRFQARLREQDERMLELELALAEVLLNQSKEIRVGSAK
jgi:hypothetical protein